MLVRSLVGRVGSLTRPLHLAPPFLVEDYVPKAQESYRDGSLEKAVEESLVELSNCKLCPRNCGVDRMKDKIGLCNVGRKAIVSTAFPHFGEESVLQVQSNTCTL